MERLIMHIDVNNAFLSWTAVDLLEQGYKYDIRNSYAVIGGDESKRHGIVLAKSMPAKKLGIVTAEPLVSARRKCKALRIYAPNYALYQKKSNALFELLSRYSPDLECVSIDECFLDYGKVKGLYGDPIAFAYRLKEEIKETLGFTVNIGIANNKFCAKMASDFSKPDKVHTLFQPEIEEKLWPLPVGELYGIGKKSTEKLIQLGLDTAEKLAHANSDLLYKYFKNQSARMIALANGLDNTEVISTYDAPKGISNTTTLPRDCSNLKEIDQVFNAISENVALALRKQGKYALVVAVIVKDKNFKSMTHQVKLHNATNITNEIYELARKLFREMWDETPVRLLGIRLDNLVTEAPVQISLFEQVEVREKDETLDKTVDALKEKYGTKIIKNAGLAEKKINKKYLNP